MPTAFFSTLVTFMLWVIYGYYIYVWHSFYYSKVACASVCTSTIISAHFEVLWTAVLSTTDVHWCSSYLDICMVYYLRIAVSMMNTKCLSLWNTRSAKSNSIFIRCSFGVLQRMFTWLWLHVHIFMLKGLCTFCRTKKPKCPQIYIKLT